MIRSVILKAIIILIFTGRVLSLEPGQVLIIANGDIPESVELAEYYCSKRNVPESNILKLPLKKELTYAISRKDYNEKIAKPVRKRIYDHPGSDRIKCIVTLYGVPVKVSGRGVREKDKPLLNEVSAKLRDKIKLVGLLKQNKSTSAEIQLKKHQNELKLLEMRVDKLKGKETDAALDSELSLVLYDDYPLYRWRKNKLANLALYYDFKTMMTSRIDGPDIDICRRIIDDSVKAENKGPEGNVYIDIGFDKTISKSKAYDDFDEHLKAAAEMFKEKGFEVKTETTQQLFQPGNCPDTLFYTGWYKLQKYVDAFDFVPGSVGYHIASLEATDLRNPDSTEWCPAMLKDGVTATIGAVAEPYLIAFPKPEAFFQELIEGKTLAESYYRTKPFNSWRMMLIGDPLYRPFKD